MSSGSHSAREAAKPAKTASAIQASFAESGQKLGLVAQVGLLLRVHGRFYLDIHGRYTACRSTWGGMDTITSELGGYQGGIGVSVRI